MKRRTGPAMLLAHTAVWFYAVILCVPLYFMLVSAVKDNTAIFANGFALPTEWIWSNLRDAWVQAALGPALINSLLVTLGAEVLSLALAIPAAYAIARSRTWVASFAERAFGLGFLIPTFAALVPTVLLAIELGLFHTRIFLIVFFAATAQPISVILLAQFMRTIPPEIEEAALVDGAGRLRLLLSVYIPLTRPGIATVFILNFLGIWNEYLFSTVLLGSETGVRTLQVALPTLVSQTNPQYGVLAAATVICTVPMFILFALTQKRMVTALSHGGVKA